MDGAFGITFKHAGILTRLLTSSYLPNVWLFIHSSENDSSSPSPRSTDKLIWFQSEHLAGSGTKHPHEFTHLHRKSSCLGDPPHVQAFIRFSLLIIANRQHPSHKPGEKIPGPALTYLKVESISWWNERDSLLRGRKWWKEDVMMRNLVAANRKLFIYDYRLVRYTSASNTWLHRMFTIT